MDIAGNKTHNVIAWGGGFNIGKDASVNFTTSQKNYLNLDYTNKASQILGTLNGGTNSIYLVNPSGVLIGKDASINANKFGVSTSPFDNNAIQTFSNNGSFSPVFNTSKGDIVNMGTIKANEVSLIAKEVGHGGVINADKITLKGNVIANIGNFSDENSNKQFLVGSFSGIDGKNIQSLNLEGDTIKFQIDKTNIDKINTISINASNLAEISQSTTDIKNNGYKLDNNKLNNSGQGKLDKFASIKDTEDWSSFASIINTGNTNNIDTFKLINDIDFNNTLVNPVGNDSNAFSGNFYGNNHTLSNLLINTDGKIVAGLFGYINNGNVKDLNIDGLDFKYGATKPQYIGGFAGYISGGDFNNIALNNIGEISSNFADNSKVALTGGFAGYIHNATFNNITLNNIKKIENIGTPPPSGSMIPTQSYYSGGFAGYISSGDFNNIILNNIENITSDFFAGGFVGQVYYGNSSTFSNIVLNNIGNIDGIFVGGFLGEQSSASSYTNITLNNIGNIICNNERGGCMIGGFAGTSNKGNYSNITLNNIGEISSGYRAGGFVGASSNETYSNIILDNIKSISGGESAGGFVGFGSGNFSNIVLNNIGNISSSSKLNSYAGGFAGYFNSSVNASNIVLNNIGKISSSSDSNSKSYAGGFVGRDILYGGTYSNIYLYLTNPIQNTSGADNYLFNKPDTNHLASFTNIHVYYTNNVTAQGNTINGVTYHQVTDTQALDAQKSQFSQIKNQEGIVEWDSKLNIFTARADGTAIEQVNGTDGKTYLHMVTNGKIGGADSEITFDGENYKLPTLLAETDISITDVTPDKDDFNKQILDSILGGSSLVFELIDGDLESIRQSLDFLITFLDNGNGVKDLFGDEYKTSSAYNPNIHNSFIVFQNAIKDNKDIDLTFLSNYKKLLDEYNNNKELYESGSLLPDNQVTLGNELEKLYQELLSYEERANVMLDVFKSLASGKINFDQDYKIFANNSSVLRFNIGIGELVNYKNTEGGGENNNDFNPPSDLSKQTELASKEAVITLPAEEEEYVITEEDLQFGRRCIVSDNAKTNNPCIATTLK